MSITTFTSRELNHDIGRAKRASLKQPVFITDRGKPSHVLLSIAQYQQLTAKQHNIADLLAMSDDIEFEAPCANIGIQAADLS